LGAGGMATVYLAEDLKHHRKVAIKVLHAELSAVLGGERFLKEIELTAGLQHPHILPLFDSGTADGLLYYVMPAVDGESLRDRLTREKQLPVADALRIATEVADALAYAHERGVVHRDIKPENILLQGGHCLVADFGIALAVQHAGGARMTQTGLSLGTPQYMSPEQATGEREIGPRSDIYSLGVVTFEMLSGEPPHTGPTAQAIFAKVMTEDAKSLITLRRTVPGHVDAAVRTALQRIPADRFASAKELGAALQNPHYTSDVTTRTASPRSASRRSRPMIAAAAVAVAGLGFFVGRKLPPQLAGAATAAGPVLRFSVPPIPGATSLRNETEGLFADGSGYAFIGDGPAGRGIWIESFSGAPPRFIAAPDAAVGARALPDRSGIAYYSFPTGGIHVNVASLLGAPARVWTDSLQFVIDVDDEGRLYGTLGPTQGLARLDRNGQHLERLTIPDTSRGETRHSLGVVLPNDRAVLFQIYRHIAIPEVGILDLESRRTTILGDGSQPQYLSNGYVVFSDTGSTILAARLSTEDLRIAGAPVPVLRGANLFTVSRNGTLLYDPAPAGGWTIGTGSPAAPRFVLASGRAEGSFKISPDGNRIVVTDGAGLAVVERDGRSRQLIVPAGTYAPLAWMSDAEVLVLRQATRDSSRLVPALYMVQVDGSAGTTPFHLPDDPAALFVDVSPSGIAYGAAGKIWWLAKGALHATSVAVGNSPSLSADGHYVAFQRNRRVMIAAVPPAAGLWDVGPGVRPQWGPDGRALFYQGQVGEERDTPSAIMSVSITRGTSLSIGSPVAAEPPPPGATTRWEVGPRDGRIYWQTTPPHGAPTVVVNWAREVDSLVRAAGTTR
jgi:eukaryotic-like serine/threonine-protein kinase